VALVSANVSADVTADTVVDSARTRIMDEAANLFLQRGYEGTSLRLLADVVGMKAGSLYYHFASKDELLTTILERGIDVMHEAFDHAERTHGDAEPFARISAHDPAHLSALYENGPYTAAHVLTFRTSPDSVAIRHYCTRRRSTNEQASGPPSGGPVLFTSLAVAYEQCPYR
jgi:AcrR family transcriptional regulator